MHTTEITYDDAAAIFGVSARQAREVIKAHAHLCQPIRYGHRSVALPLDGVMAVQKARRQAALLRAVGTHENTRRTTKRKALP
jgi:hypothetical protein